MTRFLLLLKSLFTQNIFSKTNPTLWASLFFLAFSWNGWGQVSTIYTFSQSSGTYTAITGGTVAGASNTTTTLDSQTYGSIPIGFTFSYNGNDYTTIGIATDGFISMGSTAPSNSSTPISTGTTNNVISAAGRNLFGRQFVTATTTIGSPTVVMTAGSLLGFSVGDALSGTGITTGTLVSSIASPNITMAANATSTGTSRNIRAHNGVIRYETIGSAPNRKLVVQWSKFSRSATTSPSDYFNFQIILYETTNVIDIVYDFPYVYNSTGTHQVGLRGASSSDFNNRSTSSDWNSTTAGSLNSASCSVSNTIYPTSGLTFTWTPASCVPPTLTATTGITTTSANINWNAASPAPSGGYQWEVRTSGAAGSGATGLAASGNVGAGVLTAAVSGLTTGTTYSVYVRSNCGSSTYSSWSSAGSFTTPCDNVTVFPYQQGFNIAGSIPSCYAVSEGAVGAAEHWQAGASDSSNGAGSPAEGAAFMFVNYFNASTVYNPYYLTFPTFDLPATAKRARFKIWMGAASGVNNLRFQVSTNGGGSWSNLATYTQNAANTSSSAPWEEKTVDLASYANQSVKFRLSATSNYGSGYCNIGFDDFNIEDALSCPAPTALTATSITNNAATLSWTAPASAPASGYDIYYSTSSTAPTSGTTPTVENNATTSYNASGLTAATTYYWWVRSDCGGGDTSSWASGGSFTTLQNPASIPYSETFETWPNGWSVVNGSQTNKWAVGTATAHAGTQSAYISNDSGTTNAYSHTLSVVHAYRDITFPSSSNSFGLSFYYKGQGESGYDDLKVYLVSTSTTPIAGTTLSSGQIGTAYGLNASWQNVNLTLANTYANQTWRLVFSWRNNSSGGTQPPIAVDDISIVELTCLPPTALTATSITNTTANLGWTAGGTETIWNVEYGPSGFTQGSGTTVAGTTSNPLSISGLTSNTAYQFYVQADCGGSGTSTWTGPYSFTTHLVEAIPYLQEFPTTATPSGWEVLSGNWIIGSGGAGGNPGNRIYMNFYSSETTGAFRTVTVGSVASGDELSFDYKLVNYSDTNAPVAGSGNFIVAISTDYGTNYTDLATVSNNGTAGWQHLVYDLSAYAGQNVRFKFTGNWTSGDYYLGFDNVYIKSPPTCFPPTALALGSVTNNSVDVSWTAPVTNPPGIYDIYFSTTNTAPTGSTTPTVNDNAGVTANLTGLSASTLYYWWVRSDCGGGDTSIWASGGSFTTSCDPIVALPWTENFDAVSIPAFPSCWKEENGDWVTTNNANSTLDADAHSGTQFLRESWGAINDEYMWTPGFTLDASKVYKFKFWWAGDDKSGWTGDVFVNSYQSSAGATQLGSSFVTASETTTKTYQQETFDFQPSATGTYYFSIRVNASFAPWFLSFDDFSLEEAGDLCSNPIALTIGNTFDANDIVATLQNMSGSTEIPIPGCAGFTTGDNDIWFSVVVPAPGTITVETRSNTGSTLTNTGLQVYSGTCGTLTALICDDDSSPDGLFSMVSLTGRTPGETLLVRVWDYDNINFDTFKISAYTCGSGTTTWDGAAWSDGAPTSGHATVINADYTLVTDLDVCDCQVNATKKLTIPAAKTLTVQNGINNAGEIEVAHTGSLVQVNETDTNTGSGVYKVYKSTGPYYNYDYIYWSSPVENLNIQDVFSTANGFNNYKYKFVPEKYNDTKKGINTGSGQPNSGADGFDDEGDDWTAYSSGVMDKGLGYIVMGQGSPSSFSSTNINTTHTGYTVNFTGQKVNNGSINVGISEDKYNLDGSTVPNANNINLNLVGNPYPSAISTGELYKDNSANIEPNFYFWTHAHKISNSFTGPWAYNFSNDSFASATVDTGTYTVTTNALNTGLSGLNYQYIASGQAFFVQAKSTIGAGTQLNINNSMRGATYANTSFLKEGKQDSLNRIWLSMSEPDGTKNAIVVGFSNANTDGLSANDVYRVDSGNDTEFYSVIPDTQGDFDIQFLSTFSEDKTIPLGMEILTNGTFSIQVEQTEGVFLSGQAIYLEDTYQDIIHDLTASAYTFTQTAGENINDRFVLRFTNSALSNEETALNEVKVYPNPSTGVFNVAYYGTATLQYTVYDLTGKTVFSGIGNQINLSQQALGLYFAKITDGKSVRTVKLVRE